MNREDIIRMAEESGVESSLLYEHWRCNIESMTRFAALVASAEREACAKMCEDAPEPDGADLAEHIRASGSVHKPMHPQLKAMLEEYFDKCFAQSAPQRTWVGLTDEEIAAAYCKSTDKGCDYCWRYEIPQLIKIIEAKLKEKNT